MDSQEDVGNLRNDHAEKGIGEIIDRQRLNWTWTCSIKQLYKADSKFQLQVWTLKSVTADQISEGKK